MGDERVPHRWGNRVPPTSGVFASSGRDNAFQKMQQRESPIYQRVWFITGSSGGLGRALSEAILARGERAVVTGRTPERVRDLIVRYPAQALVLELDDTRQDQVHNVVREAIDRFGQIDVLVNIDSFPEVLVKEVGPLEITTIKIEQASTTCLPAIMEAD